MLSCPSTESVRLINKTGIPLSADSVDKLWSRVRRRHPEGKSVEKLIRNCFTLTPVGVVIVVVVCLFELLSPLASCPQTPCLLYNNTSLPSYHTAAMLFDVTRVSSHCTNKQTNNQ